MALGDRAAVLGTRCQADLMVCGWAQEGLDSRATLGCSLKAISATKGNNGSLYGCSHLIP